MTKPVEPLSEEEIRSILHRVNNNGVLHETDSRRLIDKAQAHREMAEENERLRNQMTTLGSATLSTLRYRDHAEIENQQWFDALYADNEQLRTRLAAADRMAEAANQMIARFIGYERTLDITKQLDKAIAAYNATKESPLTAKAEE